MVACSDSSYNGGDNDDGADDHCCGGDDSVVDGVDTDDSVVDGVDIGDSGVDGVDIDDNGVHGVDIDGADCVVGDNNVGSGDGVCDNCVVGICYRVDGVDVDVAV